MLPLSDKKINITIFIVLLLSILAGLYFRLMGLGKWPLTVDEYYIKSYKWIFFLSAISIFVYEGSVFLAILNFIPIIWDQKNNSIDFSKIRRREFNYSHIFISLGIILLSYFIIQTDFRYIGQSNLYPEIYASVKS